MAEKIRLGESTVSGRLVRDPVEVKSRTGRQVTVFRMTRVAEQSNREVQKHGLDEIDVTLSGRGRIVAPEYASLRVGDPVTVRGHSVIDTVKNEDGVTELRQRMLAKEITQSLAASVAHFERPIPWHVREIDTEGSPRLHIPIEELEKDPALTDELVDFVPDSYRFQDGSVALGDVDMERRSDSHTENLHTAYEISQFYSPSEIREVLIRRRKVRASVRVQQAIRYLPDTLSVVPESDRPRWDQRAKKIAAERAESAELEERAGRDVAVSVDEFMVRHQLAKDLAESYPLAQLAERVDVYREQAASRHVGHAVASRPGTEVGSQIAQASGGASELSNEHLVMMQDNTLPTRPGAQGPGL